MSSNKASANHSWPMSQQTKSIKHPVISISASEGLKRLADKKHSRAQTQIKPRRSRIDKKASLPDQSVSATV
jgi:hypothetical protein